MAEGPQGSRSRLGWSWFAVGCVAGLLLVWGVYLDTPFSRVFGFADWIGNFNVRIAENYGRLGLGRTLGLQVMNLDPPVDPSDWVVYHGHPPTLDLWTAAVFSVTGSAPWAARLVPLLASVLAAFLVFGLAREEGRDPWLLLALFAATPLVIAHGVNVSYEPLCLPAMLGLVWGYLRGKRWSLLPFVFLGGWLDYPVLYLAPVFGFHELLLGRGSVRQRLAFFAAIGTTALLSMVSSVLHAPLMLDAIGVDSGKLWYEKILDALRAKGGAPLAEGFFGREFAFLSRGFTPVLLFAALAGVVLQRGRVGFVAGAFAFCGALHTLVFRSHAVVHDFWPWYFVPFVIWTGARCLAWLPRPAALGGLVWIVVLGFYGGVGVWRERALPRVRAVAADFASLDAATTTLHQLGTPPGWSIEAWSRVPMFEGTDLFAQVANDQLRSYAPYLANFAGPWAALGARRQLAVLAESQADPDKLAFLRKALPGAERAMLVGANGRYHVFDLTEFFFEPDRSPFFREHIAPEERLRLAAEARMLVLLDLFAPGSRVLYIGKCSLGERLVRQRRVRAMRHAALPAGGRPPRSDDSFLVAWPASAAAAALVHSLRDRVRYRQHAWHEAPLRVPVVLPVDS